MYYVFIPHIFHQSGWFIYKNQQKLVDNQQAELPPGGGEGEGGNENVCGEHKGHVKCTILWFYFG